MAKKKEEDRKVVFRRVRGRIVPIAIGAGVGGAAYGASRIPVKSKNNRINSERMNRRYFESKAAKSNLSASDADLIVNAPHDKKSLAAGSSKIRFSNIYKGFTEKARILSASSLKAFKKSKEPYIVKGKSNSVGKKQFFSGDRIPKKIMDSRKYLIQNKLQNKGEYRVTTSMGKVTSITHRKYKTLFPVFSPSKRKQIASFVEGAMEESIKGRRYKSGILGFDVMNSQKGLRLIEQNSGPADLFNPIKRVKARSYLLGRLPRRTALVGSAAVGIGAYLAARRKNGRK